MNIKELPPDSTIGERIPEHSLRLMTAMAGGNPLLAGNYVFYAADGWMEAIGYPIAGEYDSIAFMEAIEAVKTYTKAEDIYLIAPEIPHDFRSGILEQDRFYVLGVNAQIPGRLSHQAERAALQLKIDETTEFTPDHRRLWTEFLEYKQGAMNGRVRELYRKTPKVVGDKIRLLNARNSEGNLVACLLLDYSPANFTSYILGAHSRKFNIPHAMDLLFMHMLQNAAKEGKKFVNLGLGVNEGILRFKKKWGACASLPFQMAEWHGKTQWKNSGAHSAPAYDLALALLRGSNMSARKMMQARPIEKPFAMLWEVEKGGRTSWLGGTAHFFCHSFESSFRKLFANVDNIIFEGPLDPVFMGQVEEAGWQLEEGKKPLHDLLTETEIINLEKTVFGPQGKLAACLGLKKRPALDARNLLQKGRYWHVFFTLWTTYLERLGWRESVDMEAWRIARDMGKNIIGMENLEEQLAALGSLPPERVIRFLRNCRKWGQRARRNRQAYLAGDLEGMMGSSAEFPTHTEHVLDKRDQRFRERMRPWLEEGRTAVFVGSAHMVNLRHMLVEDGFRVRQAPYGIWPKLHLAFRNRFRPDNKVIW